jgi:hypothetical protein
LGTNAKPVARLSLKFYPQATPLGLIDEQLRLGPVLGDDQICPAIVIVVRCRSASPFPKHG